MGLTISGGAPLSLLKVTRADRLSPDPTSGGGDDGLWQRKLSSQTEEEKQKEGGKATKRLVSIRGAFPRRPTRITEITRRGKSQVNHKNG